MRFPLVGRPLAALALVLFSLVATAVPSLAASSVIALQVNPQPGGGAVVTVQFAGGAPHWRVLGAGSTEATVVFDATTVGPTVAPTVAGVAPLTSVTVLQTGTAVSVSLHMTQALPVRVRPGGPSTLFIDLVSNGVTQGLRNPALPTAPAAGTVTEVVPLKYADISEVAGVLVSGANVAPNDNFSPQQTSLGSGSLGGTF